MEIIAIINQKGGSGKTTTSVNLGASLAEKKKSVLLIDLDPQASASQWLGFKKGDKGLYNLFTDNGENGSVSELISKTCVSGLDIIPASPWLVSADKFLASEVGPETILKRHLNKLKNKTYDYILIDCSPTLGVLVLNALVAANKVIVPIETHIMAVQGLAQLMNTIKTVKERLNPKLEIDGILACRVNKRTRLSQDIIADLRERFTAKVYHTAIRESVKLAECPSFGKPITQYDTNSSGAEDYRELASEIIQRSRRSTISK